MFAGRLASDSNCTGYDVLVVGAGHAGCEASLAAARSGASTALITLKHDAAACMPCNPAIGGIAKSHLVFELDALGGEMGKNADYTGIQFRTLNTRRGPAVQAVRAQCDKRRYAARMQAVLLAATGLDLIQNEAVSLWIENQVLRGVVLRDGSHIKGRCVVLTPGTALQGRIHIGNHCREGGGNGAVAANELSEALVKLGLHIRRLKTGTPPRLHRDSLDYGKMDVQPGERPPPLFSWHARREADMFHVEHKPPGRTFHVEHPTVLRPWPPGHDPLPCYLTHTTKESHEHIRRNLSRSALYSGSIQGTGVRYCPSVEDKIVKFPDKSSHHLFIEPEGRDTELIYPNGLSNSLPEDVQEKLVRSIPGLEKAHILHWAYAIEYDFADPTGLSHALESKHLPNLFLAGQINGTTGYEEAAVQGFVAGINAARRTQNRPAITFSRSDAYIGVLIDDLVTKGTDEPYRMFTSLAERRLLLRQDNARFRMLSAAQEIGIQDPDFIRETATFSRQIEQEIQRLHRDRHQGYALAHLLRRPETIHADLPPPPTRLHPEVARQVGILVKYEGYIERELREVEKARNLESVALPNDLDYSAINALRLEAKEKFARVTPENLGQAARIPGISPADIAILSVWIKQGTPT